jgi:ribosome-binding ATPase YchF (GTP1/OBG family)
LEDDLVHPGRNPHVAAVEAYVRAHHDAASCVICSKIEEELSEMNPQDAADFLAEMGVNDSGVSQLIRATYDLLGLASYFTAGEKEVRAWTFHKGMKAPECAGVIHTDFQAGFIKAEVASYSDLIHAGSKAAARDAGKLRMEGKEYIFKDGDVVEFRFSKTN